MPSPLSTYRVQLRPEFGFDDVARIAPYLATLGISHVYLSPHLQAAPRSTHGYDIVDPGRVSKELGGPDGHARMCAALECHGVRQLIDIVPNHMAIAGRDNKWWWDVLRHGASSRYAGYFDIDSNPRVRKVRNLVLLPVLGDHYGRVLEAGDLTLAFSGGESGGESDGEYVIRYHDDEFPVDPATIDLPENATVEINAINGDVDRLDLLIRTQNYRLAYWRVADAELDYRRFFDINGLVALRAERDEVFEDTHHLVLEWLESGAIDGLRIDHVDGLREPLGYLTRLRERSETAWLVVEKILEPTERLPVSWPVGGTTGYDAMHRISGLFVDARAETAMTHLYEHFTGEMMSWGDLVTQGKELAVRDLLASDVDRLTNYLARACDSHRRMRDYTRAQLRTALGGLLVAFPVYRSYVVARLNQVSQADESDIGYAVREAKCRHPEIDEELFDFLEAIFTLKVQGDAESSLVMRFQQLSGAVMAKGVEDTAFYRYNRLLTLNEVGGSPGHFAVSRGDFHDACIDAQRCRPLSMVATTTHDTKRSEDVRYRIALLSEMPVEWGRAVHRWSAMNERYRRAVNTALPDDARLPDRNMEYLLYQTLVGAYPLDVERAKEYARKASKEAKVFTSWTDPDVSYDEALTGFLEGICSNSEFLNDLEQFVTPLIPAARITSLAATTLKLTTPGVPDIYQGTELWDLSLVDPDNRRPVDYQHRADLLAKVQDVAKLQDVDDGIDKLRVIHRLLQLRKRRPDCFNERGEYCPLVVDGERSAHVAAYLRGNDVAVVVPRLVWGVAGDWADTSVRLPDGRWRNVFTDGIVAGGLVELADMLREFPVAAFESANGESVNGESGDENVAV